MTMNNNSKLIKAEEDILNEIYNLILDESITDFEREKLKIAKNLLEKEGNYLVVMKRIQITFMSRSLKGINSKKFNEFYSKLPEIIGLEMENFVGFAAGAFLAPPQPL